MRNIPREIADKYQGLFNLLNQEHDLILTVEEMDEIILEVQKLVKNFSIAPVSDSLPEFGSKELIGEVEARYKEIYSPAKRWDVWRGFYNGWLEGRAELYAQLKGNKD